VNNVYCIAIVFRHAMDWLRLIYAAVIYPDSFPVTRIGIVFSACSLPFRNFSPHLIGRHRLLRRAIPASGSIHAATEKITGASKKRIKSKRCDAGVGFALGRAAQRSDVLDGFAPNAGCDLSIRMLFEMSCSKSC
jgi:hypothetical protein